MDIRQMKLELINQISQCNDRAVLQAVANVLALGKTGEEDKHATHLSFPFVEQTKKGQDLDADARALQRDMDEAFGEL